MLYSERSERLIKLCHSEVVLWHALVWFSILNHSIITVRPRIISQRLKRVYGEIKQTNRARENEEEAMESGNAQESANRT